MLEWQSRLRYCDHTGHGYACSHEGEAPFSAFTLLVVYIWCLSICAYTVLEEKICFSLRAGSRILHCYKRLVVQMLQTVQLCST